MSATPARYQLTAVAFVHGVGGRVRVLFTVDRNDEQLHGGEPVVLVEHRPGAPAQLQLETADAIDGRVDTELRDRTCDRLAALIDAAFDDAGAFRRERLLGAAIHFEADITLFDPDPT